MSFLETILNLFKNNKKNAKIIVQDLNKNYGESTPLEIGLYENTVPLANQELSIIINNVEYKRTTNNTGIATLNINLNAGKYTALIKYTNPDYNTVTAYANINITEPKTNTRMEGTDINKPYGDNTPYQCAIYNNKNERIYDTVYITVNGKTYNKTPDTNGLYKLNINLNTGEYTIKAVFTGNNKYNSSEVTNKIKITKPVNTTEVKETNTKTVKLNNYLTNTGCSGMGQCTSFNCAPNSLQQAFFRLTGIHVSESTIASWAGTTSNGTGHDGINTAVAQFNRKYNTSIKITWKNFNDLGNNDSERWEQLQHYIDNGAVFCHILYRNRYGHYEVPKSVNKENLTILNSLGNKCNSPAYCGYIETRNKPTQLSYIRGISQKSIAIMEA